MQLQILIYAFLQLTLQSLELILPIYATSFSSILYCRISEIALNQNIKSIQSSFQDIHDSSQSVQIVLFISPYTRRSRLFASQNRFGTGPRTGTNRLHSYLLVIKQSLSTWVCSGLFGTCTYLFMAIYLYERSMCMVR